MIGMTTVDKEGRAKIESVILVPKDYVQVVRCKDCKYGQEKGKGFFLHNLELGAPRVCKILGIPMPSRGYCSYGERKEERCL